MSAIFFTTNFIEYILNEEISPLKGVSAIAGEVPFLDFVRRADLIVITDDKTIAIEVKSSSDNLTTAAEQSIDYCNVFEEVYFAINEIHYPEITLHVPRSVGIIIERNGTFELKRKATLKKRINKYLALSILNTKDLERISRSAGLHKKNLSSLDMRLYLSENLNIEQTKEAIRVSLLCIAQKGFKLFKSEIGETVHSDDLLYLNRKRSSIIQQTSRYKIEKNE